MSQPRNKPKRQRNRERAQVPPRVVMPEPRSVRLRNRALAITQWAVERPRLIRIVLAGVFTLAIVEVVRPIVDDLYLRFLFASETATAPAIVLAALAVVLYGVGWWLLIGMVGERPPVRWALFWYLVIGLMAILYIVAALVRGIIIGVEPT